MISTSKLSIGPSRSSTQLIRNLSNQKLDNPDQNSGEPSDVTDDTDDGVLIELLNPNLIKPTPIAMTSTPVKNAPGLSSPSTSPSKCNDSSLQMGTLLDKSANVDALSVLFEILESHPRMRDDSSVQAFLRKHGHVMSSIKDSTAGIKDFIRLNTIGVGHFGEIIKVRHIHTKKKYALKRLEKSSLLLMPGSVMIMEERDIMASAESRWINKLHCSFQDTDNLYLVMEYQPGGDLFNRLHSCDDIFSEDMARFYLAEMAHAIHALHEMGYAHRDIKPDNVLIDASGHIKLTDFGSASKLGFLNANTFQKAIGTPDYVAPEILDSTIAGTNGYNASVDWWSFGVTAFEMLYGEMPFSHEHEAITLSNILQYELTLSFPEDCVQPSSAARDMIENLLCDSKHRLGYEQLRAHPFFASTDFDNLEAVEPPYVPELGDEGGDSDDEQMDVIESFKPTLNSTVMPVIRSSECAQQLQQLSFVGYTYSEEAQTSEGIVTNAGLLTKLVTAEHKLQEAEEDRALMISQHQQKQRAAEERIQHLTTRIRESPIRHVTNVNVSELPASSRPQLIDVLFEEKEEEEEVDQQIAVTDHTIPSWKRDLIDDRARRASLKKREEPNDEKEKETPAKEQRKQLQRQHKLQRPQPQDDKLQRRRELRAAHRVPDFDMMSKTSSAEGTAPQRVASLRKTTQSSKSSCSPASHHPGPVQVTEETAVVPPWKKALIEARKSRQVKEVTSQEQKKPENKYAHLPVWMRDLVVKRASRTSVYKVPQSIPKLNFTSEC